MARPTFAGMTRTANVEEPSRLFWKRQDAASTLRRTLTPVDLPSIRVVPADLFIGRYSQFIDADRDEIRLSNVAR